MKKILSAVAASAIAVGCALALPACGTNLSSKASGFLSLGTYARLVVSADFSDGENSRKFDSLVSEAGNFLNRLQSSLSSDGENSYICRYNSAPAGSWVEVDELTYTVLSEALCMYEYTNGYYNPAVYYSVDLFGFSTRFNTYSHSADISTRTPYDRTDSFVDEDTGETVEYVTAYAEPDEYYVSIFADLASHMSEVRVERREDGYYAYKPEYAVQGLYGDEYTLALDLGGLAKGYAADYIDGLMEGYGFEYGYFNFGSSSFSVRRSYETEDGTWSMSLNNPDGGSAYATIYISSVGLSTSGDYERYYIAPDGTRYCHIIDPFSGRPINSGIAACTVAGGSAARDDALTTALLVMGEEVAAQFINANLKDYSVTMIVRGSSGRCEHIVSNVTDLSYNAQYVLANTIDEEGNIVLNG